MIVFWRSLPCELFLETLWLTRTKTPAHWPHKLKHINAPWHWNTSTLRDTETHQCSAEGKQKKILSYAREDHVLNNNLCVKFVIPLIFTEIRRKVIRLFNKGNGVSFMWFIYVTMELWKVPRQDHFIFVISINFTGLFQLLRYDDRLLENLFLVWPTYCSWQITQVAT